jgi:bifunctional DNA-binding transcriptional regulator/antitoxin component of YhaV-PrlF toxin-antitoxin module
MPDTTTLQKASTISEKSLRTTVPVMITRHFKLKAGDMLQWEIKAKKKDEFEIIVTPMKKKWGKGKDE